MPGQQITDESLLNLPAIRPDGSQTTPGVISVEEAKRIDDERLRRESGVQETEEQKATRLASEEQARKQEEEARRRRDEGQETPEEKLAREAKEKEDRDRQAAGAAVTELDLKRVVKIGGQDFTVEALVNEMQEAYEVDISQLSGQQQEKMLKGYIAQKHDEAWKRSNTVESQKNADTRKVQNQREQELRAQEQTLARKQEGIIQVRARLAAEKKKLQTVIEKKISKDDIYKVENGQRTSEIDPDKLTQYNRTQLAQERLQELETDEQEIAKESVQTDTDYLLAKIDLFQATVPQYSLSEPLMDVIEKVRVKKQLDHPDASKIDDIYDIVHYAAENGYSIEYAYQRLLAKGALTVKPSAASTPPAPSHASAREDLVRNLARRQQSGTQFLDNAGAQPTRVAILPKKTLASKMRDASGKALGGGQDNQALKDLDY